MFQLQVSNKDVSNGTVAVSWTLDQDIINDLAKAGLTDPQVIICVAPMLRYHITKEYRKVVPLKDLMAYVEFRAPGPNKIWGFISYDKKKRKDIHEFFMEKKAGQFHTNILNYDGDNYASWLRDLENEPTETYQGVEIQYKTLSRPIQVEVPKGVFAAPPPAWEESWVNYLFRDNVIDQCEYRRRRLFAYTLQPIWMVGNLFARLFLTLAGCLILAKGVHYKFLAHPLTYTMEDTLETFQKGSIVVFHLPEDDESMVKFPKPGYFIRSFWLMPLMPIIWLPFALMMFANGFTAMAVLAVIYTTVVAVLLTAAFLANYFKAFGRPFIWAMKMLDKLTETTDMWYLNSDEAELILADPNKKPLSFNNIPGRHKSARLRFQALKAKVCKPFSL